MRGYLKKVTANDATTSRDRISPQTDTFDGGDDTVTVLLYTIQLELLENTNTVMTKENSISKRNLCTIQNGTGENNHSRVK
jgi:hypothetical protein